MDEDRYDYFCIILRIQCTVVHFGEYVFTSETCVLFSSIKGGQVGL